MGKPRSRTSTRTIGADASTAELQRMLVSQLDNSMDMDVVDKNYIALKTCVEQLDESLDALRRYANADDVITPIMDECVRFLGTHYKGDHTKLTEAEFKTVYTKLKEDAFLKTVAAIAGASKQHLPHLRNHEADYIIKMPIGSLVIVTIDIDLRDMILTLRSGDNPDAARITNELQDIFANIIHNAIEFRNIIMAPHIDAKKFADLMVISLDKLLKVQGLDRCNDAVAYLKRHVSLLTSNIGEYYSHAMRTGDASTILVSFISDCGKNTSTAGMKMGVRTQLAQIVRYAQKVAAQNKSKPNKDLDTLFDIFYQLNGDEGTST